MTRTISPVGALSESDLSTAIGGFEGQLINPVTLKTGESIVLVQRLCSECDTYREMAHGQIKSVDINSFGHLTFFDLRPQLSNGRGGYTHDVNIYRYERQHVVGAVWFLSPRHADELLHMSQQREQDCTHMPVYELCGADFMDGVEVALLRMSCGYCEPSPYVVVEEGPLRDLQVNIHGRVSTATLNGEEINLTTIKSSDTVLVPRSQVNAWRSDVECTHP